MESKAPRLPRLLSGETSPLRGRQAPPATVLGRSDVSIDMESQSSGTRSGFEAGNRLPGIRQLLLAITCTNPDPFTSVTRHLSEQPGRFSSITLSPSSESQPSPPIVLSESGRSPLPEPHQFFSWARLPCESSSPDIGYATDSQQRLFVRDSSETSLPTHSLPTLRLSPRSSPESVFQTHQSPQVSTQTNPSNHDWACGADPRPYGDSYMFEHSAGESLRPSIWQDTQLHVDWGRTKAGKPRKRLAQACLSCRKKKIRCHPNLATARCQQCEKSSANCRFESG